MKAKWLGWILALATVAAAIGKYNPNRYDKAGPKPKRWVKSTYYGNPLGPVEYCSYEQMMWPINRLLLKRRPITQAKHDTLAARIPKNGIFAIQVGATKRGPVNRISFRGPTSKDSTELGSCDASAHVPGLTGGPHTAFQHNFGPSKFADEVTFECPLPFAPRDSFFIHAFTKDGQALFRAKFYRDPF